MPKKRPETAEVSKNDMRSDGARAHEYRSVDTPEGTIVITDHATLKVFYDPMRQRILRTLYTPMSVAELGDELDESPNRLYYHVRLLEQHGLIVVAEERRAGSNLERLYGRAATRYELAPDLIDEGTRLAAPVADDFMGRLLDRFARLLVNRDEPDQLRLVLTEVKQISPARADELAERLETLLHEYLGPDAPGDKDGVRYAALSLLLPEAEPTGAKR
jgi:DNA-binding transcriptional ArsR family regulator